MHLIHPLFAKVTYLFSIKKYEAVLFNRFHIGSLKEDVEPDSAEDTFPKEEEEVIQHRQDFEKSDVEKEQKTFGKKEPQEEKSTQYSSRPKDGPLPKYVPPKEKSKDKKPKIKKKEKKIAKEKQEEAVSKSTFRDKMSKVKKIIQFSLNQKRIAKKTIIWLRRVISKFFRVVTLNFLSMYVKAGFKDPAFTGVLHGFFTGIFHGLDINDYGNFKVDFEPVFENKDVFAFEGAVSIKTSLAQLLWPVIVALFTFPYISAFILWRRIKRLRIVFKK